MNLFQEDHKIVRFHLPVGKMGSEIRFLEFFLSQFRTSDLIFFISYLACNRLTNTPYSHLRISDQCLTIQNKKIKTYPQVFYDLL